jgi:transmembrane sensor
MAHETARTDGRTIDDEAARWAVRLSAEPLSSEEQEELDSWQAADPRHQGALIRARAAWTGLDRFVALSGQGRARDSNLPVPASPQLNRRWVMAASLGVLSLMGIGAWVTLQMRAESFVSRVGEQRRVVLDDGSTMLLNTATRAVTRFDEQRREVQMTQGEALFTVAKDPRRPFIVRIGEFRIMAVGTAFAVRADEARVDVTVTEGVVELTQGGEGALVASPRRIAANQRASVTKTRPIEVRDVDAEEMQRRLSWRDGMVAFDGQPLSEAIAEINRYSNKRIVVADPILAGRPVVGIFQAADADAFSRAAATALGVDVVDDGDFIRLGPDTAR